MEKNHVIASIPRTVPYGGSLSSVSSSASIEWSMVACLAAVTPLAPHDLPYRLYREESRTSVVLSPFLSYKLGAYLCAK
jgi:hypothetical protein